MEQKEKKKSKLFIVMMVFFSVLLILFIVGLIMTFVSDSKLGNAALLLSGLVDLMFAGIVFLVHRHRTRYICPECGTRRNHTRRLIRTEEKQSTFTSNGGTGTKIEYKHIFEGAFTCPQCGETLEIQETQSGGHIMYLPNGHTSDRRVEPRELY